MGKGMLSMFRRRARNDTMDDYEARRVARGYEGNRQKMDPVPVAPPIGYKRQPSMADHVREMVRSELLRREVEKKGLETFEEADDFGEDDPDDAVPLSGYESEFDPPAVQEAYRKASETKEEASETKEAPPAPSTPPPAEKPPEGA